MWGLYELLVREAWLKAVRRGKRTRRFLWAVGILIVVAVMTHPDFLNWAWFFQPRGKKFVRWVKWVWETRATTEG